MGWLHSYESKIQRLIQPEDSDWTLMVNNKRKNIQRPIMEDLHISNVTNYTRRDIGPSENRRYYIFTWEQLGKKAIHR